MRNPTKLVIAAGIVGVTLASASFAREDAAPRGGDTRHDRMERSQPKVDAIRSAAMPTAQTSRANDDPAGDRRGRRDVPDDNNRNRRNDDGPNHR